ncbi:ATP-binding protein [Lysobacter sp. 22409]|uniref:ATP-binding protein n=1 Tax=Lysobacter sp. 22409 TaxID=3453917 RepID=UPI003F86783A
MNRDPSLLGIVESTSGSSVTVALNTETLSGLVYIDGQGHRVGQVGSFVRIPQGFSSLFGIVIQAGAAVSGGGKAEPAENTGGRRWMTVEIVGEGRSGEPFSRGVYRYPTIGDEVHLVTEFDLAVVYGAETSRNHVEIGSLSSASSIPARIEVNRIVTRHCAVVGATGSGKSTTVAGLLHGISDKDRFPSARIVLLDLHGEYAGAFREKGHVYRVQPDVTKGERALAIPYWALTFNELLPLTFGDVDDMARGRIADWILINKRRVAESGLYGNVDPEWVTVDSPLPFSLKQLWYDMRWEIDATYPKATDQIPGNAKVEDAGDADKLIPAKFSPNDGVNVVLTKSTLTIRRPLEALASRLRDPRFNFIFSPNEWSPKADGNTEKDLPDLLALWLGSGGDDHRPVSILDVSGIPTFVLESLVGALLRLLFDAVFWGRKLSEGGRERPLLVVMEEAHLYLSDSNSTAGVAVKRIVKEGRKYGIGAMIVSQRPTEIDQTILSQCGTFIALRMGNSLDRGHVTSATTESLRGLLDLLPTLRTGEAIIVGEAVQLPTRAMIRRPPRGNQPNSDDPRVVEVEYAEGESGPGGWDKSVEVSDYSDLVNAWRRQDSDSSKVKK